MIMLNFKNIFRKSQNVIIGMVHIRALPGSPLNSLSFDSIREKARLEASIYQSNNSDGIIIENMFDVPYERNSEQSPHTTAFMTSIASNLRKDCGLNYPIGIQILSSANKQALAVAKAASLNFIRCEGFVFSHIGDEGFNDSCAANLLRYRKQINAENIAIFTDIQKKHCSHAITGDLTIGEIARAAEMFLSDGLIITGKFTGVSPDKQNLHDVKSCSPNLPIIIGSGMNETCLDLLQYSNACIIGSHFKKDGNWKNELDEDRIKNFMQKLITL